jgi:flavin reductase (DIM6/NTAB) family NADH-FMN oxidoreductase RutF
VDGPAIANIFDRLDRELWLVTSQSAGRRGGLIATCVSQASIVPELPRVMVGLSRQHHTWELVESSRAFALHLLAEEQLGWVWRFALQSGKEADKFDGLAWREGASGSPILTDALGWLDCRVETHLDSGDRIFYLAEVLDGAMADHAGPLTLKRLLQLATPEQLQRLKERRQRDIMLDAPLIKDWREADP